MTSFDESVPGLEELLRANSGPVPYAVPPPQVSMSDLLSGAPMPETAPMPQPATPSGAATLYADSPAPGAAAGATAPQLPQAGAGGNFLDTAKGWVQSNPQKAQMLMQAFTTLAQHRGGLASGVGAATGAANQYALEQTAANQARDVAAGKEATLNARNALNDASLNAERGAHTAAVKQTMQQNEELFASKKEKIGVELEAARQGIAGAKTEDEVRRANIALKKIELKIHQQYGPAQAEALLNKTATDTANAQEAGLGTILSNAQRQQDLETTAGMTPEERAVRLGATKGKAKKSPADIAQELIKEDSTRYMKKDGTLDTELLKKHVMAIADIENFDTTDAWTTARNAVPVGQSYVGPDGKRYKRKAETK